MRWPLLWLCERRAEGGGSHRVRMWNVSTDQTRTVAGTGVPGYAGDYGSAEQAWLNGPTGLAMWNMVGVAAANHLRTSVGCCVHASQQQDAQHAPEQVAECPACHRTW